MTFEISDTNLDSLLCDRTYGIGSNRVLSSTSRLPNGQSVREARDELQEVIQYKKQTTLKDMSCIEFG